MKIMFSVKEREANVYQSLLPALTRRLVECVGPVFLSFWQVEPGISHDALTLQEEEESEDELSSSFIDPDDVNFLRSLDPKEWKVSNYLLPYTFLL